MTSSRRPTRDRTGHLRLGRADVRDGHPQRHAGLVLGRRPAGGAGRRPGRARPSRTARPDGRRGRRPPRRRRRVDAARPRAGGRGRGARPRRAGHRGRPRRPAGMPISVDTTKPSRRRGRARRRRRPRQRRLGRRRRTTRSSGSPRSAASRSSSCTTGREPATTTSWPRSSPTCGAALDRARRLGVAGRRPHRRPGLRVRQDRRATTSTLLRELGALRVLGRPSCSGRRASRPSARSSTCRPTSGSRRRSRRPRSASRPAPTSSGSTTSEANVRAARMSDAIVRGDLAARTDATGSS